MAKLLKTYSGATVVGVLLALVLLYWLELESAGAIGLVVVLSLLVTNGVAGLLSGLLGGRKDRDGDRSGDGKRGTA
ncbi:MAG: hypothetical protein ACLF0P_16635 [Thermoanaerobaculia bacterium]